MKLTIITYSTLLIAGWFLLASGQATCQSTTEPRPLQISYNKTSTLVFPAIIKSVDRGSRDILAQKAKEVGNVLQLKAARENFPETNLTVITSDGILHQFTVNYAVEPSVLLLDMNKESSGSVTPLIFATDMTETAMEEYAAAIVQSKRIIHFKKTGKYKIGLALLGIYIKENVMFYRLRITNQSNINYDVDFLKFYVRDDSKIKRTASQEVEVRPLYVHGEVKIIKGRSESEVVFVLDKFTIPNAKHLDVELFEKMGGRHLRIKIKNKAIVKARLLP